MIIGLWFGHIIMLQCELLEKFPEEAGTKDPSARMIPFLPGIVVTLEVVKLSDFFKLNILHIQSRSLQRCGSCLIRCLQASFYATVWFEQE